MAPVINTPTVCEKCMTLHSLRDFLMERLVFAESNIAEGLLTCPDCGYEQHCYYMDDETRAKRSIVMQKMNVARSQSTKIRDTYAEVQLLQRQYQQVYDDCQEKYKQLLEKVVA